MTMTLMLGIGTKKFTRNILKKQSSNPEVDYHVFWVGLAILEVAGLQIYDMLKMMLNRSQDLDKNE
jgi:cytochrome oxidase assembly protein ShyY1